VRLSTIQLISSLSDDIVRYCIEIPIAGQRPFEGGDVALFRSLLETRNKGEKTASAPISYYTYRSLVPVIVVFTKLDRLQFREQKRLKKLYIDQGMDPKSAQAKAKLDCVAAAKKEYETSCVAILQSKFVPAAWARFCPVSNKRNVALRNLRHMFMFLPFVRARLHNKLNRTHQVHSPAIGVLEHSLGVSANGSAIHRLDVILFLIQCIRPILISKLKCRWSI